MTTIPSGVRSEDIQAEVFVKTFNLKFSNLKLYHMVILAVVCIMSFRWHASTAAAVRMPKRVQIVEFSALTFDVGDTIF